VVIDVVLKEDDLYEWLEIVLSACYGGSHKCAPEEHVRRLGRDRQLTGQNGGHLDTTTQHMGSEQNLAQPED